MRNMNLLKTAAHSFLKKLHKGKKKDINPYSCLPLMALKRYLKAHYG